MSLSTLAAVPKQKKEERKTRSVERQAWKDNEPQRERRRNSRKKARRVEMGGLTNEAVDGTTRHVVELCRRFVRSEPEPTVRPSYDYRTKFHSLRKGLSGLILILWGIHWLSTSH